ncbi:MAG: siderophore-interacting protein [Saccharopolyspora sp.]|uniref:siderophore-interacting protein n=1 Tax=Saccharopolyspora TaxID=1835 RepID=UPI00190E03CD|nr:MULTISPECIES: siderophore-interacting protein [unclassified Saccharopolyspora]MBK0868146.1 siderophore-interacting protein [Saccharopolyspora sp. HNM0986]MBQ6642464.1 siderophore-interacting protein [Saccharopolyspora sp.]
MTTADRARRGGHPRPPTRTLEVLRTADLTPSMRRITLGGDEIAGFRDEHTGPNIKVFVPQRGQRRPVLPVFDHDAGRHVWPEAHERPTMRTYTVRRYDEARGELDVDFVMHGEHGVASSWARGAAPGDYLGVQGPGGRTPRAADWYLLIGDETALPAISAIIEGLPLTASGEAFLEVSDSAEQQHIECPPNLNLNWLHRDGVPAGRSTKLGDAVRELDIPPQRDVSAWVSGESGVVRGIRRHLRRDRGLDAASVLAIGYWKAGMVETDYHDQYNHDRD